MSRSFKNDNNKNFMIVAMIITMSFLVINFSLYILNETYLVNKVEDENVAFTGMVTHLANENDLEIVSEYIKHYNHIHQVNIRMLAKNNDVVMSTSDDNFDGKSYEISTVQGTFILVINNEGSKTVTQIELNLTLINLVLLVVYIVSVIVLVRFNISKEKRVNQDLEKLKELIFGIRLESKDLEYYEFRHIYDTIIKDKENIDLLTEQKNYNLKGMAHDIKTPLTLILNSLKDIELQKNFDVRLALKSTEKINSIITDMIDFEMNKELKEINLSKVLTDKLSFYDKVFKSKNIQINSMITESIMIKWELREFETLVENLLSNVYYYSKENSLLTVCLDQSDHISLIFESTPERTDNIDINSIFQKGYRGDNGANEYGKGLGLYICRLLLASVSGEILAELVNEKIVFKVII